MNNLFYAKITKEGQVEFSNKKALRDFLSTILGKDVTVTIERVTGKRSLNQNDWLWGCVYKVIADHTGHTEQEIHEYMKRVCLPPKFKTILGKEMKLPASTTSLNKYDFSIYVEKIRAEVSSMGIMIPDPVKPQGNMPEYPSENLTPTI